MFKGDFFQKTSKYASVNYFKTYSDFLNDEIQKNIYLNIFEQNKHLFKDKIILDVGAGTGVLSLLAA